MLDSSPENGQVSDAPRDEESLGRELRTYKKTETYLKTENDGTLARPTKRILRDAAEENRQRRSDLNTLLKERLIVEADYFVAGQPLKIKSQAPGRHLRDALEYLIANTFTKMSYIKVRNPSRPEGNPGDPPLERHRAADPQAHNRRGQSRGHRRTPQLHRPLHKTSKQIVLYDLIENRFANRPYGWPDLEVALLLARLLVLGEISLVMDGGVIPLDKCYDALTTPAKWRKIVDHPAADSQARGGQEGPHARARRVLRDGAGG